MNGNIKTRTFTLSIMAYFLLWSTVSPTIAQTAAGRDSAATIPLNREGVVRIDDAPDAAATFDVTTKPDSVITHTSSPPHSLPLDSVTVQIPKDDIKFTGLSSSPIDGRDKEQGLSE